MGVWVNFESGRSKEVLDSVARASWFCPSCVVMASRVQPASSFLADLVFFEEILDC